MVTDWTGLHSVLLRGNLGITICSITKSSLQWTVFFTPVVLKCMKKNLDLMKPHYSEQILAIPWPLIMSRFYYLWLFLNPFFIFLQHWESVKNCVPSSCYSWNWGWSYRFLPWISHLWAMSTHGWSPLGWRSRS